MPPRLIVDIESIDLDRILISKEEIRRVVPQRHEMEQIDAIHHYDPEARVAVASRRIGSDEWWVRGHIPGRPIFPGVLTVEAAAQLSTWLYKTTVGDPRFLGFTGLDEVRFRGPVLPGQRLVLLSRIEKVGSRKSVTQCQAAVDGKLVFQGLITGMAV